MPDAPSSSLSISSAIRSTSSRSLSIFQGEVGLHLQQRREGAVHVLGDAGLEFGSAGLHLLKRFRLRPLVLKGRHGCMEPESARRVKEADGPTLICRIKAILWPLNHGFFPFRFEEIPDSVSLPQQLLSAR